MFPIEFDNLIPENKIDERCVIKIKYLPNIKTRQVIF